MKRMILILFPLIILISGCELLSRSPAEKSTDPDVIAAVAHAEAEKARARDTSNLVWMGGAALVAGIAIRFASNSLLPKSTGIGIGIAAGGAACLAIARFDSALQRVALPTIITILAIAGAWVVWRVYQHAVKARKKK